MGNKRNRRSWREEYQSSDTDESTSETIFEQGDTTLGDVYENGNTIFDKSLGSGQTERSQTSIETEAISQTLLKLH